ncbi:MAG: alpha/beta hydrolase [Eubacterium sp.]|nr:alpha/beta hydrolase [Eubacterium sp.]
MTDFIFETKKGHKIKYYRGGQGDKTYVLIHAQGTSSKSYFSIAKKLGQKAQVLLLDCYGHGGSDKEKSLYSLACIGDDFFELFSTLQLSNINLVGHSSGGLIAAYIESKYHCCQELFLEDPPFFSSWGGRRFKTYNYVDLSSVCHDYLEEDKKEDFVTYYFEHQYAWNFFPEKSREKLRGKMVENAKKFRKKHPDRDLQVSFWPKDALEGFKGMNDYDPYFGLTFYDNSFHQDIDYEELLGNIKCPTTFLKAQTKTDPETGLLMAALSEEDLNHVARLVKNLEIVRCRCGHAIHVEKKRQFLAALDHREYREVDLKALLSGRNNQ